MQALYIARCVRSGSSCQAAKNKTCYQFGHFPEPVANQPSDKHPAGGHHEGREPDRCRVDAGSGCRRDEGGERSSLWRGGGGTLERRVEHMDSHA